MEKGQTEHDENLKKVLQRSKEYNIKLKNKDKCKMGVNSLQFLGYIFTDKGIEIDQEKVDAILKIDRPDDVNGMERFLRIVNYILKCVAVASSLTAPLRHMIKEHNADYKLNVDASSTGVGAVLLQNDLWTQIEKESLTMVLGCKCFHQYIYGKKIIVESDHKPLIPILSKPLNATAIGIQKMRLKLQPYYVKVTYKPGKELYIADALSRAHARITKKEMACRKK